MFACFGSRLSNQAGFIFDKFQPAGNTAVSTELALSILLETVPAFQKRTKSQWANFLGIRVD